MPSGIKNIWNFSKNTEMCKKNIYRLCNIRRLEQSIKSRFNPHFLLLLKYMKVEVFYCTNDMHVRTMRFSILCTPADSSDKTQLIFSTVLLCFFVSKYDINGSRLNCRTISSNKFKYINMYIICKDTA